MNKPWLESNSWPRTVRSGTRKAMKTSWGMAALWNLISWPTVMVLPEELGRGNHAALLVLLFPVAGIFIIAHAVRLTRSWHRFGVAELTLDPYPGSIGGHVGGCIRIQRFDFAGEVETVLECVHSFVRRSGSKRQRRMEVTWQIAGPAEVVPTPDGPEIRFRFDVPEGLPASGDPGRDDYYFWRLSLRAGQPGVSFSRSFKIGVFPTAEEARGIRFNSSARAAEEAVRVLRGAMIDEVHRTRLLEEHGLEVEQSNGWLRLYLHAGRQRGMALVTFLVGVVFAAVPFVVPDEGFTTSVIRLTFGVFGFCLLLLSLYLPFNSLDVRISRKKIKRIRSWFGVVVSAREIRPGELEELEIGRGSSASSGTDTTVFYQLVGKGNFGRLKLIESIPDRALVEAVREQVMTAAGLKSWATH